MQHLPCHRHFPDFQARILGGFEPKELCGHHHFLSVEVVGTNAFHDHHSAGVVLVNTLNHLEHLERCQFRGLETRGVFDWSPNQHAFRFDTDELIQSRSIVYRPSRFCSGL